MNKLLIFLSFILLFSCASKEEKIALALKEAEQIEEKKDAENAKISKDEIPEWFIATDSINDNLISAVATSVSSDLQMSYDNSLLIAKKNLADKISGYVKSRTVSTLSQEGIDMDSNDYNEVTTAIVANVSNTNLAGYVVSNKKIINIKNKYRSYVKLVYPIGSANKILVEKVNKEEQLKLRLESSEAFKELEEQIKNAQDE